MFSHVTASTAFGLEGFHASQVLIVRAENESVARFHGVMLLALAEDGRHLVSCHHGGKFLLDVPTPLGLEKPSVAGRPQAGRSCSMKS